MGEAQVVAGGVEVEGHLARSQILTGVAAVDERIGEGEALPGGRRLAPARGGHGPQHQVGILGQQRRIGGDGAHVGETDAVRRDDRRIAVEHFVADQVVSVGQVDLAQVDGAVLLEGGQELAERPPVGEINRCRRRALRAHDQGRRAGVDDVLEAGFQLLELIGRRLPDGVWADFALGLGYGAVACGRYLQPAD